MKNLQLPRGYQDARYLHQKLYKDDEYFNIRRGRRRALNQFHAMAKRVPAYRDFLKSYEINPKTIKTTDDLKKVPLVDKDNYLRKYPLEDLCWDGKFGNGNWVISTTSGSTGKPYYFPRQTSQDWQYAVSAELYLRNNFEIHKKKTLYIVAFPMGAWIGGLFTYEALKIVAEKGEYDLSVITPGIHKQEVINAVKQLGSSFDQVIIGAYAPFLKDILDDGIRQGVDWPSCNLGFVFSAEAFSEDFRDYVLRVSQSKDAFRSTLNHYGTVDMGTMAHETPESVMIRRELVIADKLSALFPEDHRQPTFCQYDPALFYFEEEENNLICTAFSGIPLCRYDLKDYGGIIDRKKVKSQLKKAGLDLERMLKNNGIDETSWSLPFVYIYERNDFSVSYYAFLLYPDMVRRALLISSLADFLTGKFTMSVDYDKAGRQNLNIYVEMKHGIDDSKLLADKVCSCIHAKLIEESSEYRETATVVGEVIKPKIQLLEYEHSDYFRPGVKQKWIK